MTRPLIRTLGGTSGFGEDFLAANDDGSTPEISVSAIFENGLNFFGTVYDSLWVNNNGSVTFNNSLRTFTPSTISAGTTPGIFPYWADVDTRGVTGNVSPGGTSQGTNLVWYDLDTANDRFVVTWDDVGFFSSNSTLQNAFQLVIEDASDDLGRTEGDFNIEFRYENVDWTTGNASGGTNGLAGENGTPARAGYSSDTGVFFELPQSGLETALLQLPDTPGNTGQDGLWRFEVRNGEVPKSVSIISNGDVLEGDTGTTEMVFTVQRGGNTEGTLELSWSANGFPPLAANSGDIVGLLPQGGMLFFDEGVTSQTITLEVTGDTQVEPDETIIVSISDPVTSTDETPVFVSSFAFGTILNDDIAPPPPPPGGRRSDVYGDPHIVTLDGLGYDFQAVGEFVMLESTDATRPMNIQMRTTPISDVVSFTTAVAFEMGTSTVELDSSRANVLTVDGQSVTVNELTGPLDVGGGQIYFIDDMYTFVMASGEQLKMAVSDAGAINVCAFLDEDRPAGSVRGLLGNSDGDTVNDLALRDGTVLSQPIDFETLYGDYADSWRISEEEALFERADGETTADYQDSSYPRGVVTLEDLPADIVATATRAVDAAGITDPILRDAAILDFALTGDSAYIAGAGAVAADPTVEAEPTNTPALGTNLLIAGPGGNPEGDAGTSTFIYTVDRFGDTAGELTVDYTIGGQVNADDIDGPLSGSVTFADGETRQTIIVSVNGDEDAERDETLRVSITADDADVTYAARTVTSVIEDDDAVENVVGDGEPNTLVGDNTANTMLGLGGNDTMSGNGGADRMFGGEDNDDMTGGEGNDVLDGEGGNDSINGGIGFDTILGGLGDDTVVGVNGFDQIFGGDGNDLLRGNFGNDTVEGGAGDDTVEGGLGFDLMRGDDGNDSLQARDGFDTLEGGAGDDTLQGNNGNDSLVGGDGADRLEGGLGADVMSGGAGNDTVFGANGFDILDGDAGDDRLEGNFGNDTMHGGAGDDVLRGGIGADTFIYTEGADRIADLQPVDSVQIAASLLSEATPVPEDLRDYASLNADGFIVLDFGDGNSLTFTGITNATAIIDDVTFI
ncbi:nidogen-like domain-containing protein [Cognatishimia sp. F0-27]|uniref:nidogen-like domain-containing protein n=1 Tax=Cognatishimia sp. F0-27 TaxID=2816855 RepID=UPI001D0C473F|nr:nidogen-like domain-containing protein [Cognatishimia sp. F0-27]MCC1492044.1 VWD domain-containing protein [Cognatishimia sp. F0-27]